MKIFGVFLLIAAVGLFKGCSEIKYAIGGEEAEATFNRISKGYARRGEANHKFALYTFTDVDGKRCTGACAVSLDWDSPSDGKLDIEYMPGKREAGTTNTVSRLKGAGGSASWIMLIIGVVGSLVSGIVWIKAMESDRPD